MTDAATEPGTGRTSTEGPLIDIADRVLEIARTDPHRVALVHAKRSLRGPRYVRHTYGELSARAEALAVGLRGIGVEEGTRCSFMVPPGIDALVLGVALWRIGAVIVGIEPHSHGLRRVARCLARVEPEVFFGTPEAHLARVAFGWGRRSVRTKVVVGPVPLPGMHSLKQLERAGAGRSPRPAQVSPSDPAVIAFTTGSTGQPKPTVLRQRNLASMIDTVSNHWSVEHGEAIDMPTFPMFWIIGLSNGGTVVVPPMNFTVKGPGDADPARLVRTIDDCDVRSMFASPALLTNLASYAHEQGRTLTSVRRIVAGGAEVPGPLMARVKAVLAPEGEMYADYGATEALPVAEIDGTTVVEQTWPQTERGAGVCVGWPLPGVDVRIVEVTDGPIASWADARELPRGQIGEVVARSPHISEDYYRQPESTAANKIPDEGGPWHRLGDTGYVDAEGRLWVCGRCSHRVVADADVLYPLRCEPVFNRHPAVARSALVGVERDGRVVPTICIERADGATASTAALEAELRDLAASHEATRAVEAFVFLDRLPVDRRHNAKIDRPRLATQLSAPA